MNVLPAITNKRSPGCTIHFQESRPRNIGYVLVALESVIEEGVDIIHVPESAKGIIYLWKGLLQIVSEFISLFQSGPKRFQR